MKYKHDIGKIMADEGEKNRESIFVFLRENPGVKQKDCADHLGFTPHTVGRHLKAIRAGWRPKENA